MAFEARLMCMAFEARLMCMAFVARLMCMAFVACLMCMAFEAHLMYMVSDILAQLLVVLASTADQMIHHSLLCTQMVRVDETIAELGLTGAQDTKIGSSCFFSRTCQHASEESCDYIWYTPCSVRSIYNHVTDQLSLPLFSWQETGLLRCVIWCQGCMLPLV